ncbi:LuxR C-terminal-related transcriptional regulator [Amycolatopsis alba]|uniref:LuxR C-terminal-related transcriptional regulator n=1 Tax=Amycolatopsis alba TaxID=76020 RepID=UPI00036E35D8|nr:LuxR C-terminal-related transcriptional regulator [Amycolatopsis alba]
MSGLEMMEEAVGREMADLGRSLAVQHEELMRRQRQVAETRAEVIRLLTAGQAEPPPGDSLNGKELALLKLLAAGCTDAAAAGRLHISHRTARRMMAALMERLGARSRFEAGVKAARLGWL